MTTALYWACLAMPRWPLHPVGLVLIWTWFAQALWASVFLGWLAKALVVSLGGSSAYARARNVALGLILGDVFSAVLWSTVPFVLNAFGMTIHQVRIWPYQ